MPNKILEKLYENKSLSSEESYDIFNKVIMNAGANKRLNCDGSFVDTRDSIDLRLVNDVLNNEVGSVLSSHINLSVNDVLSHVLRHLLKVPVHNGHGGDLDSLGGGRKGLSEPGSSILWVGGSDIEHSTSFPIKICDREHLHVDIVHSSHNGHSESRVCGQNSGRLEEVECDLLVLTV